MSDDDWYCNESWNADIEERFFEKLKRARFQRFHYISTQANKLAKSHPDVALRLLDLEGPEWNLPTRAKIMLELGDIPQAMKFYRMALKEEERRPNIQTGIHLIYPVIVAERQISSEFANAIATLDKYQDRLTFPLDHFNWHAAKALIMNDAWHARKALEFAEVTKSGFRYHQDLGLVGKEQESIIRRLVKINENQG